VLVEHHIELAVVEATDRSDCGGEGVLCDLWNIGRKKMLRATSLRLSLSEGCKPDE